MLDFLQRRSLLVRLFLAACGLTVVVVGVHIATDLGRADDLRFSSAAFAANIEYGGDGSILRLTLLPIKQRRSADIAVVINWASFSHRALSWMLPFADETRYDVQVYGVSNLDEVQVFGVANLAANDYEIVCEHVAAWGEEPQEDISPIPEAVQNLLRDDGAATADGFVLRPFGLILNVALALLISFLLLMGGALLSARRALDEGPGERDTQ